jgi:hypothetical protein
MFRNLEQFIAAPSSTWHNDPNPTARTPGSLLNRSNRSSVKTTLCSGVVYCFTGKLNAIVNTLSVVHPSWVVRSSTKLFSSKPAATSSTTVNAISAVSRIFRSDAFDTLPPTERDESCSATDILLLVADKAGSKPASKAAIQTTLAVNSKTIPSTWIASALGRSCQRLVSHRVPAIASTNPNAPPATQMISVSDICSRIRAARPAPNAPRIAVSFCRAAARATSKFETFRHPISSMHTTAHDITISGVFTSCTTSSSRGLAFASSATGAQPLHMHLILQRAHRSHALFRLTSGRIRAITQLPWSS